MQVPEGWKYKSLAELGSHSRPSVKAGPFGSALKKEFYVKEGYKVYGQEQVISGDPFFGDYYIDQEKYNALKSCSVQPGDILISLVGTIGRVLVIPKNAKEGIINPRLLRISLDSEKVFTSFAKHFFEDEKTKKKLESWAQGGTMGVLNAEMLKVLHIPLPPFSEQQKIAQILSTWDKAIEKLEALIAAKQKRKKALMQQLLTGKKRFAGFDGEWKTYKLSDIADKKKKWSFTGGPFGSNLKAQDYTESGVRIIQLQNIGDGQFFDSYKIYTSDEKANELLSCNIYPGEIIISKMGDPVARACFIPSSAERFLMASDGIRLAVDEEKFNKKFIHDYINYKIFRKTAIEVSTGSTRQRIGLDDLRKLTLFAPSILEQQKIASVLTAADTEIETHQKQLAALKEQKKGLMQQLLTGKKRVIL